MVTNKKCLRKQRERRLQANTETEFLFFSQLDTTTNGESLHKTALFLSLSLSSRLLQQDGKLITELWLQRASVSPVGKALHDRGMKKLYEDVGADKWHRKR